MKIWHPDTKCLSGGPKTFMKYFDEYFKDELIEDWRKADIIFGLNNWVDLNIITTAKMLGAKYVHRANGVYRPILLNVPNWEHRNEEIKPHYLEADYVIFQSVFSRRSYFEYIGKTEEFSIIYNGVDVEEYNPSKIMYSELGYEEKFDLMLGKKLTQKELDVVNYCKNYEWKFEKLNPYTSKEELFQQLHGCNLAVDPDPQANCNNLILELMALGIPVICLAEGGNPELCLPELISSPEDIVSKIQYVLNNQEFFSKRARAHVASLFNIKDCMKKYRKVFEEELG